MKACVDIAEINLRWRLMESDAEEKIQWTPGLNPSSVTHQLLTKSHNRPESSAIIFVFHQKRDQHSTWLCLSSNTNL